MNSNKRPAVILSFTLSLLILILPSLPAGASGRRFSPPGRMTTGEKVALFESIDENMQPVSMADMIDGKPLVLAVGSCT